jgi:hypothetical protein
VLVQIAPAIPVDCVAEVNGGFIAPVSAIHYSAQFVNPAAQQNEADRFAATGPMARLVRREVDPENPTLPFGNLPQRAILDYVVAFNLSFAMNNANRGKGIADQYNVGTFTDTALTVNANPERIRSVRIELAARAPHANPNFPFISATCAGLRCFQILQADNFAARVRMLRSEVFVPNIAYEGY